MFGDLEKSCSAIWSYRVRRFGEIVFDDFGEIVFGDLELLCSAISACLASALEIVMEWHIARQP